MNNLAIIMQLIIENVRLFNIIVLCICATNILGSYINTYPQYGVLVLYCREMHPLPPLFFFPHFLTHYDA